MAGQAVSIIKVSCPSFKAIAFIIIHYCNIARILLINCQRIVVCSFGPVSDQNVAFILFYEIISVISPCYLRNLFLTIPNFSVP